MVTTSLVFNTPEPALNVNETRASNCSWEKEEPDGSVRLFTASTALFVSLVKKASAFDCVIGEV
nr:hypothetical protein [Clostridium sp. 12(A)]